MRPVSDEREVRAAARREFRAAAWAGRGPLATRSRQRADAHGADLHASGLRPGAAEPEPRDPRGAGRHRADPVPDPERPGGVSRPDPRPLRPPRRGTARRSGLPHPPGAGRRDAPHGRRPAGPARPRYRARLPREPRLHGLLRPALGAALHRRVLPVPPVARHRHRRRGARPVPPDPGDGLGHGRLDPRGGARGRRAPRLHRHGAPDGAPALGPGDAGPDGGPVAGPGETPPRHGDRRQRPRHRLRRRRAPDANDAAIGHPRPRRLSRRAGGGDGGRDARRHGPLGPRPGAGRSRHRQLEILLGRAPGLGPPRPFLPRREPAALTPLPAPRESVRITALSIAAPGTDTLVLHDVNVALAPGSALGVIGPSGSGKSTLARALVGLARPNRGMIRFDGAAIDQWDPDALGRAVGYLPQEIEMIDGTIAQNITRFDAAPDPEALLRAARAAGVHEIVLRLPGGYDARVGPGGLGLSGGQRQRIALARALYGDPFLVVLDEPNSNLDVEGDRALAASVQAVRARGGIAVVVAHRPSALTAVDRILVLADGRVQLHGPRDEVLAKLNALTRQVPTRVA
ncbi:hypothetical protein Lal_00014493 [Lupinus albus]|nr:hypothetical protein Lal_00014493 [Lupinus albus]